MRSNTTNYQLESAQDPAGGPTSIRAKKFYGSGGGGPGGSASGPGAGRESAATEGPAPAAGGGVKTRRSAAPAPAPADGAGPGPSDARAGRKGTARKPAGRGASTEEGPERKVLTHNIFFGALVPVQLVARCLGYTRLRCLSPATLHLSYMPAH